MHICAPPRCRYTQINAESYRCEASGEIHRCGAACTLRLPNRDATLICPISGRCFDQSIARHPYQRSTQRVLVNTTVAPASQRHRDASALTTYREQPSRDAFRDAVLRVLAPKTGMKRRRDATPTAKQKQRDHIKYSLTDERIDYYVDSATLFWGKLVETTYGRQSIVKLRVLDVVLGLLYTMRVGMRCPRTNRVALVKDAELGRSLPSVQSVDESGIPKKRIRVGKNHVRSVVLEICATAPSSALPLYPAYCPVVKSPL